MVHRVTFRVHFAKIESKEGDFMNNIKSGLFIKEKRNEKNLTQKELAEKLNCTDKAISRWETGKGFPEVSFLIPLSEALDVSVNEIILGEEIKKEEIIEKTNNVIVETIKTSNKKINTANLIVFILLLLIEVYAFYISPLKFMQVDIWGCIILECFAVIICSFITGFLNLKFLYKLVFIPIKIALFIPSTLIFVQFDPFYTFGYSGIYIAVSLLLILLSTGIRKLIIKLHNLIKK